jgi:hypothetical protein
LCLYVPRLSNVDLSTLRRIVQSSVNHLKQGKPPLYV